MTKHAHISGRYDSDPTTFAGYVAEVLAHSGADSFTTTETYRRHVRALRKALGRAWIVACRGEYVIGVRRAVYKRPRNKAAVGRYSRLSRVYNGDDTWRDLWVYRRAFVHRATGRAVLFYAIHLPKIEHGDAEQQAAAREGLAGLRDAIKKATGRRPDLAVVAGADVNADHHNIRWRRQVEMRLDLRSCWSEKQPVTGTHGPRLIDAIFSTEPLRPGHVAPVAKPQDVDHRPIYAVLDLKERAA